MDVLLIDRHNYFTFTPLLYQVASSLLNASDIAYPVRKVLRHSTNLRFRQASVVQIDRGARTLLTHDNDTLHYDYLVLATGSTTNFFGNQSVERNALGLKTLSEALQLRNHILSALEQASHAEEDDAASWMSFVIVGGGPTGVEYAGALAELMKLVLAKEYPDIGVPPRIVLVEGREQLLGAFSKKLGDYTKKRLEKLGVEVKLGTLVKQSDGDTVMLSNGDHIASRTLIWSAGVKAEPAPEGAALPLTGRSKRIEVDAYQRVKGDPRAFAIGDVAGFVQDDAELPMLSAPAMQQGRYVGDFILAHLGDAPGDPTKMAPFSYVDKGTMATIGRNAAICKLGKLELTGLIGWLCWLLVHIVYLIGFRNRLVVLWSWCWNYVHYDRPVRIIARARASQLNEAPPSQR